MKIFKTRKGRIWYIFAFLLILRLTISPSSCTFDKTYQGKVIDSETLKPIQGAVVISKWREWRGAGFLDKSSIKIAKETLTAENGEWIIIGPKGQYDGSRGGEIILSYLLGPFLQHPSFITYKPGYKVRGSASTFSGGFIAFPYIDKTSNIEGIVLGRTGNTKEEMKDYFREFESFMPLIPVKDPEEKLRALNFSFQYPKEVRKIGQWSDRRAYDLYAVVGLAEAKTKDERLEAMRFSIGGDKELPKVIYMILEERERLLGSGK